MSRSRGLLAVAATASTWVRRATRAISFIVSAAFRADPKLAGLLGVITVGEALLSICVAWVLKLLLDGILAADHQQVVASCVLVGLYAALWLVGQWTAVTAQTTLSERTSHSMEAQLMHLVGEAAEIRHIEDPDFQNQLYTLSERKRSLANAIPILAETVAIVIRFAGAALLLATLSPPLALFPLFAIPPIIAAARVQKIIFEMLNKIAAPSRLARHLFKVSTEVQSGTELRVFGLEDELARRQRALLEEIDAIQNRARLRTVAVTAAGWSIFAVGLVGALWLVLWGVAHGGNRAGDMFLVVALAAQLSGQVQSASVVVATFAQQLRVLEKYRWIEEYVRGQTQALPRTTSAAPPPTLTRPIELKGVSFSYQNGVEALRGIDLTIPPATMVALVGDNGAGKTTLVKLLLGLYQPTAGEIVVEGSGLASIDPDQWRSATAAGFQDFCRFEFVLRESVGVGDLDRVEDPATVLAALDRAASSDVVPAVPDGLEARLGRRFGGTELSTGQWQKVALGRSMMRPVPLLLALDEPTASLDAETEHRLFVRYRTVARELAEGCGGITFVVSHRYSSVRAADLIVVLDQGVVVEVGSHAGLIGRGGRYAELFKAQAEAYS